MYILEFTSYNKQCGCGSSSVMGTFLDADGAIFAMDEIVESLSMGQDCFRKADAFTQCGTTNRGDDVVFHIYGISDDYMSEFNDMAKWFMS